MSNYDIKFKIGDEVDNDNMPSLNPYTVLSIEINKSKENNHEICYRLESLSKRAWTIASEEFIKKHIPTPDPVPTPDPGRNYILEGQYEASSILFESIMPKSTCGIIQLEASPESGQLFIHVGCTGPSADFGWQSFITPNTKRGVDEIRRLIGALQEWVDSRREGNHE